MRSAGQRTTVGTVDNGREMLVSAGKPAQLGPVHLTDAEGRQTFHCGGLPRGPDCPGRVEYPRFRRSVQDQVQARMKHVIVWERARTRLGTSRRCARALYFLTAA